MPDLECVKCGTVSIDALCAPCKLWFSASKSKAFDAIQEAREKRKKLRELTIK